jgi:site-specific recombinase XerC
MQDLEYELRGMVRRASRTAYGTRAARENVLMQAARALHEMGYRKMKPESLKPKHVEALVAHWQQQGLTPGTMKNRMSHLRWWAGAINKAPVVARENAHYGIDNRRFVTGEDKGRQLEAEKLARIRDPHIRLSLRLQAAFGLRREESLKFSPAYADRGDRIQLKDSWTKGGKARAIPVRNPEQRALLDEARRLAGRGSLIPANKTYIQHLRTYERATVRAGLDRNHGLRHAYAQVRYAELTGWHCPAAGGPSRQSMTPQQRERDREARQQVSRELGHERISVVAVYCG